MTPSQTSKTYRAARGRRHHAFVIAGLLAVAGLVLTFVAEPDERFKDPQTTGAVVLLLATAVIAKGLWDSRRGEVLLRLGPAGLWFKHWNAEVAWTEIAAIETGGKRIRPLIAVALKDFETFQKNSGIKQGPFAKPPALLIPGGAVEGDFAELLATLRVAKDTWG